MIPIQPPRRPQPPDDDDLAECPPAILSSVARYAKRRQAHQRICEQLEEERARLYETIDDWATGGAA